MIFIFKMRFVLASAMLGFIGVLIFLIIIPDYEYHFRVKKEEVSRAQIINQAQALPKVMSGNKQMARLLQKKLQLPVALQFLENALSESHLMIQSLKPYQGGEHDEIQLKVRGRYCGLLQFLSLLSRQPNALEVVYLSVEKKETQIIFKEVAND